MSRPHQRTETYKGTEMLMIDAINNPSINIHGFTYNSVKRRMKHFDMTFEQAISIPRMKNAPGNNQSKDYSGPIDVSMDHVNPKIREAMLLNNNAFLRACDEYGI